MQSQPNDLDSILKKAHEVGATDVHMCAGSVPMARVKSKLTPLEGTSRLMPSDIEDMLVLLLSEAQLATLDRDRVLDFSFTHASTGRCRCNIYSQRGSYAVAIRTLPYDIPQFETLGLPQVVKEFSAHDKGLFLVTGATGSGKSTTLASLIDIVNANHSYHIVTIEDPIEYLHRHKKSLITQREIGGDAPSFAAALRSALREDPDVIMVGEMRDPETIAIALTAAETGHLVFSTLHTVGAAKSIDRIVDAFPSGQQPQVRTQLASVLEAVVSQQLVPRKDGSSITAACEVMLCNPAIRNLIRDGKHYQIPSIMQISQGQGMQLMDADLARLVKAGVITREDAESRTQDLQLFTQFVNKR